MEAKELRIGNLICLSDGCQPFVIENLLSDGKCTLLSPLSTFSKSKYIDILPILLTEEWLLKFNFSKIGLNYSFHAYGVEFIVWTKLREFQPIGLYFRFDNFDIELKYAHQLQNLYFALTGKELKIN